MATYIPNITDVFPEPYIFKPDLAFYDKMLQRKTALYEQGVAKTRSAFESVLNAPLTNKFNIPIRDQYIKDAREQLTKMAGLDFSQPQNVAAARGIFAPFWEDKFIVKDAEYTKSYQTEAAILNGWKNSTDPKVRENYNGIAAQYLNNGLDVLANAERTDGAFSKIEKRKAVPFTNLEKYLNDQAGKERLTIKWDDPSSDGAYLVSTENGERSKKHFATWAESMIGNNFYEQFNVTGIVEKEQRYKQYKSNFPNLTDQEIYGKIADDVVGEFDKGYQKRKDYIALEIARIQGLLKGMPPTLTAANKQAVDQYRNQLAELNGRSDLIDKEYEINFSKNKQDQFRNNITLNPDGFFAKLAKQRVVDNWSTGVSSLESRKITANEAFFKTQEMYEKQKRMELDIAKYELDKTKAEWDRDQDIWERYNAKPGTTGSKDGTTVNSLGQLVDKKGNVITAPIEGVDTKTGARYVGLGTTDITKTGTAGDVYNKRQKDLFYSAFNLAFNADGLLYFAKQGLGFTDAEVTSIASAIDNEMRSDVFNPGAPPYKFTADQAAATKKLEKALSENPHVKAAGIKIEGPYGLRNALIAYTQGYLKDKVESAKNNKDANGNPAPYDFFLTPQEQKALINYEIATQNLQNYEANENNRKKILNDYAQKNAKEASKYFVKRSDGTYDLLTSSELVKNSEINDFSKLNFTTYVKSHLPANIDPFGMFGVPIQKKLSSEEITKAIMSGNFEYTISRTGQAASARTGDPVGVREVEIKINGEKYSVSDPTKAAQLIENFENKHGKISEFSNNYKKVYNETVPNLFYYSGLTGKMGANFRLDFDTDKDKDKSYVILDQVMEPANSSVYIEEANGVIREAKSDEMQAIRTFKGKEKEMEKYFGGYTYNTSGGGKLEGRPNISIDFGPVNDASNIVVGGKALTELAGKKFIFAINESSPDLPGDLKQLPNNSGFYVYQSLLQGKTFKSNAMMESTGFKFSLTPNRDGSSPQSMPDNARLSLTYDVRVNTVDPDTKEMKSEMVTRTINDEVFYFNQKTPDEMVFRMQELYFKNLLENQAKQKEYEAYLEARKKQQVATGSSNTPQVFDRDAYYRQIGINL